MKSHHSRKVRLNAGNTVQENHSQSSVAVFTENNTLLIPAPHILTSRRTISRYVLLQTLTMLGSVHLFGNKKKLPSFDKLFASILKILFIIERPKIFFRSKDPGHTLHPCAQDLHNVMMYKRKKMGSTLIKQMPQLQTAKTLVKNVK